MKGYKMNEKRYYRFHLDVLYFDLYGRKHSIDDYQEFILARSLREAWKLIKFHLSYGGYSNFKFLKAEVFSIHNQYICTLKSIN